MTTRRRVVVTVMAAVLASAAVGLYMRGAATADGLPGSGSKGPDARAPEGVRIRVEVLNATRTRGLARRATMHLRDRGFDVVLTGTASEQRDSTLVLDHAAKPEWARLVGLAMGGAPVVARPDSSRHVDVTVLIGTTWHPPSEPFYP